MSKFTRRGLIKTSATVGAGLAMPTFITSPLAAYTNAPTGGSVTLGFNVPQSGPYADEGADELRAYKLAVEHLNGGGDGGMMNTFSSKALTGNGILGKKVEYVTGDTQTKSDAARASAKSMIEKDGAVMITGGSSSGVAIAVQGLCQEAGVIFMAGLTHSNDTTGKDKKANGFRHFFNGYMSGAALAPVLEARYGNDRNAYHLTADYTWGWTQQESLLILVIGIIPPAVEVANTSIESLSMSIEIGFRLTGNLISSARSKTVCLVTPSKTPLSGVLSPVASTQKILNPGPSEILFPSSTKITESTLES